MASRSGSRRGAARSGVTPHPPAPIDQPLGHISALIAAGGHILVGRLDPIECAAIAYDGSTAVAMLRRKTAETLPQLLERLDAAVGQAWRTGSVVDDLNT